MTYDITLQARYVDGKQLTLSFNTKSVLLHEAMTDAEIELFGARGNAGLNPFETPVFMQVNLKPRRD